MRVKFLVNLGSRDAERHALDFRACQQGEEREVSEKAAEWLIRKGIASERPQSEPEQQVIPAIELPAEIRAIPDPPSIGESDGSEIKADTKPARGAAKKSNISQKDD